MNILLFTSAMKDSDFAEYQNSAKTKINPSNQNFYSKLIRALSLKNSVSVVSHRPLTKSTFSKKVLEKASFFDKNTKFYYTFEMANYVYKLLQEKKSILNTAKLAIEDFKSNDFIIIVDPLRLNLVRAAKKIAKKYNVKIIGMLTDNPLNLSSGNELVHKYLIKEASSFDGYLSLTHGLVNVFNYDVPSYVFEGLVAEEEEERKDPIFNYFYFGGSLYEKYGVKTLVDAFHESNIHNKLVIAGNGPLQKYIEELAEQDYRILYISQISKGKAFSYMRNSIANINPRPLDKKLDSESVPSKLLEYLSIGIPTISTKYDKFYGAFKDDVTWIEGNDKESLKATLESFDLTKEEEYMKKAVTARRKIFEFYGLDVQAESINYFLTTINSSANK